MTSGTTDYSDPMRAVDPILTAALAAGTGKPYMIAHVGYFDGSLKYNATPSRYRLTGQFLEVEIPVVTDYGRDQETIWLERGLTINGTNYSVVSGRFAIANQEYQDDKSQVIRASILPKKRYTAAGYDTYKNVIDAFCTAFGKTAVYRNPAEAWLNYIFLPYGKQVIMNDANLFFNLLIQKRLIHACDNGSEQILFYSADVMGAPDATVQVKDEFNINTTKLRSRQYIWRDENQTVHTDGAADDPYHNLGYLESTNSPPARNAPTFEAKALIRPDLRILDGDIIELQLYDANAGDIFAHPIELYEPRGSTRPAWRLQLEANPVFQNTEGGALPSTIERISNYTPLNTSTFDKILSSADNNLQAAMETLDEHKHDVIASNGLAGVIAGAATQYLVPYHGGYINVQLPWPYTATLSQLPRQHIERTARRRLPRPDRNGQRRRICPLHHHPRRLTRRLVRGPRQHRRHRLR